MGETNSLLVDAIAEYLRMHGKGMVFSPEIERLIGRPLGRDMQSAQPRQAVIDALQQKINAAPLPQGAPAVPQTPSAGYVRG